MFPSIIIHKYTSYVTKFIQNFNDLHEVDPQANMAATLQQ